MLTHPVIDLLHWPAAYTRSENAWSILASSGILKIRDTRQKPMWLQETLLHHRPSGESWKISQGCLCTEAAGSLSLHWLGESLLDNLAIWHHPRLSQDWPQRQTGCFCVRISQGPANPSLQSILCRWPGNLFSRTLSGHHRKTSTAGS